MQAVQVAPVRGPVRLALVALAATLTACVDTVGPVPYAYYGSQQSTRNCRPPEPLGEREATAGAPRCADWTSGPPARRASR